MSDMPLIVGAVSLPTRLHAWFRSFRCEAAPSTMASMHFVLFDEIQETHVVRSLARALEQRGHKVLTTGPIWHGHKLPTTDEEKDAILVNLRYCLEQEPDVLFNFRASSLTPAMVDEVRACGVRSMVWLPDDPVLYGICYRHIVDAYDDVLHCAGVEIMQFYEERHGRSGVNFPFWTNIEEWPDIAPASPPEVDVVFLGNCDGPVRSARYSIVSSLPFSTRIHGRVPSDPEGISGGVLGSDYEVAVALSKARVGLSIPQFFSAYEGSPYDFPELANLGPGHFEFPSRVIQFARLGLPVVSLQPQPTPFDEFVTASDTELLVERIREILAEPSATTRRLAVRRRFDQSFSAAARAELLEQMALTPDEFAQKSTAERATLYATRLDADSTSGS